MKTKIIAVTSFLIALSALATAPAHAAKYQYQVSCAISDVDYTKETRPGFVAGAPCSAVVSFDSLDFTAIPSEPLDSNNRYKSDSADVEFTVNGVKYQSKGIYLVALSAGEEIKLIILSQDFSVNLKVLYSYAGYSLPQGGTTVAAIDAIMKGVFQASPTNANNYLFFSNSAYSNFCGATEYCYGLLTYGSATAMDWTVSQPTVSAFAPVTIAPNPAQRTVTASWAASAQNNFTLQQAEALGGTNGWSNAPGSTQSGDLQSVTVPMASQGYFRLVPTP